MTKEYQTLSEAISILERHNEWRRGKDIPMTSPKILGDAIEIVIGAAKAWRDVWHIAQSYHDVRIPSGREYPLRRAKKPHGRGF